MARAEHQSLRFGRFESKRLIFALLLSLCVHFGAWGGYELGKKFGWWERLHLPAWLHHNEVQKKNLPRAAAPEQETQPTVFVDVAQADLEPPKKAVYFSDKNSQAANPDAGQDSNQPKLDGKQKEILKAMDVPRMAKLQPTPQTQPQAEPQPSAEQNLGDQQMAKAVNTDTPEEKVTPHDRPRTLKEARAQQQLPGPQLQEEGGVHRTRLIPSFDAKATAFGQYNAAMITAIQQYWDDELDSHQFAQDRTGRVTIRFVLHFDGTVSNVEILENDVGILLGSFCQESIDQTAPYGRWPSDMLHEIGSTERTITFTFIYY